MGDDHIDRQVELVEHRAAGLLRIVFDAVALTVASARDAFAQLEVIAVECRPRIRGRRCQKAKL